MASDSEASCVADPNFAVICSFLEKFGTQCGITSPDFLELQEMLENTQELSEYLVNLHVKLMRKVKKSVSTDRWERVLIKLCHNYCSQDAWELERFGYKKARLSSKLRILKQLLEMQFDYNPKFKVEINKQTSNELRTNPIGRDKHGHSYWYQIDEHCEMRIYREDPDEETWDLVAKDREGLVRLITQLSSGDPSLGELTLNEDSNTNSLEIEKPITDTGQTSSSLEIDESSVGNEDSKESVIDPIPKDSSSSCDQIITPAVVKAPEKSDAPSDLKITISTRQVHNKIETAIVLPIKEETSANEKPQVEPSTKLEVGMDLSLPQSTSQSLTTRIVDLSNKKKKSINELAANLRFKTQDQLCNKIPVQEQEIDLSMKKNAMDPKQFSSLSVPPFEPISIESALQMSTDCLETEEEFDEEEEEEDEEEEDDEEEEEDDDDEELDESDEINLPSHMMKRPRLDRPTLLGNRKKKYSDNEDDDEYGDEIEEPVMMIRGEGSGRECNNENLFNFDEVGEEIEEEIMFFYGEGSGNDCKTGNIKKDESPSKKQEKASSSSNVNSGENTERNRAATMKDINEGMGKTISTNVKSVGNTLKCEKTDTESDVKSESTNETPKPHKVGTIVIDIKSPQTTNTPSPIKKSRWDVGRPVDPHIFATPDSVPQKYDPKKLDSKLTAMSSNISINNQLKSEIPARKLFDTTDNETHDEVNNDNITEIKRSLTNTACSSQLLKDDLNLTLKGNVQDLVSKWEQVSNEQKSTKNNDTSTETETDENTKQIDTELCSTPSRKPAMFFFGPGCFKINTPLVEEKRTTLVESDQEIKNENKIDEKCSGIAPKNKADKSINNLIHETKINTDLPAFPHTNISENAIIKNKDVPFEEYSDGKNELCNNDKKSETVVTKSNITVSDKDKTQIIEILPILTNTDAGTISVNKSELKSPEICRKENISVVAEIAKESPDKLEESNIVYSKDKAIEQSLKHDASIEIKENVTLSDDSLNIEKSIENVQSNELESNSILTDRKDDFVEISEPLLEENLNPHNFESSDTVQVSTLSTKCEKFKENIDTSLIKEVTEEENKLEETFVDKAKCMDVNKSENNEIESNIKIDNSSKQSKILTEKYIEPEIVEESRLHISDESIEELKKSTATMETSPETVSSMPDKMVDKTREDTKSTENIVDTVLESEVTGLEVNIKLKSSKAEEKEIEIKEQLDDVANSKNIMGQTLKCTEDNKPEVNPEVCPMETDVRTDTIVDSKTITAKETQASTVAEIENPISIVMEPVVEQSVAKQAKETGSNSDEQDKSYVQIIKESKTVHIKSTSGTISVEKQVCEPLEEMGSKTDEHDRTYFASIDESKCLLKKSDPETISVEGQVKVSSEQTEYKKDDSYISVAKIENSKDNLDKAVSLVDISERVDEEFSTATSTEKELEYITTTKKNIVMPNEISTETKLHVEGSIEEAVIVSEKESTEVESEMLSTAEVILPDSEHDKTVDELIDELQTEIKTAEQIKLTDEIFINPNIETVTTDKMPQLLILKESDTNVDESIEETNMETENVSTKNITISESHVELSEPLTKEVTETVSLAMGINKIVDESVNETSTVEVSTEEIVLVPETEKASLETSIELSPITQLTNISKSISSATESKKNIDETVAENTSGVDDQHKEETVSLFESKLTSLEKQKEQLEKEVSESEFDKHKEEDIVSIFKSDVTSLKTQAEQLNIEESREQRTESRTVEISNITSSGIVDQPVPKVAEDKRNKLELSEIPYQDMSIDTTIKDIVSEPHPTESTLNDTPLQIEQTLSSHDSKNDDTNIDPKHGADDLKLKENEINILLIEESQSLQENKTDESIMEPKSVEKENQISSSEDIQFLPKDNIDAETAKKGYSKQDEISSSIDESQPSRINETSDLDIKLESTTENICDETSVSSIEETQVSQKTKNNLNTDTKLITVSKSEEEIRISSNDCYQPLQKNNIDDLNIEPESTADSKSTVVIQVSSCEQPPLQDKNVDLNIGSATESKSDEETQSLQENKEHIESSATNTKTEKEKNSTTVIAESQILVVAKSVIEVTQVSLLGEIKSSHNDKQAEKCTIESKYKEDTRISSTDECQPLEKDKKAAKSTIESKLEEIQISSMVPSKNLEKDKQEEKSTIETKSDEEIQISLMDECQPSHKDKHETKSTIETKSEEDIHISLMDQRQFSQIDKQDAKLTIEIKSEEKIQIPLVAVSYVAAVVQINKDDSLSLNDKPAIAENHEEQMECVLNVEITPEIPITACEMNANSEQLDSKTNDKDTVVKVQSETKTILDINPMAESTDKVLPSNTVSDISVENMQSVPEQLQPQIEQNFEKVLSEPQTSMINEMEAKLSKGELLEKVETIVSKTIEKMKPSSVDDISKNINNKDKENSENVTKESVDTDENPTAITHFVHGEDKLILNDSINAENEIIDNTSENVAKKSVNMNKDSSDIKPMDDNNDKIADMAVIDHSSEKNVKVDIKENLNEIITLADKKESNSISVDTTTTLQSKISNDNVKVHDPNDKLDTSKCKDSETMIDNETIIDKETVKANFDELNSTKKSKIQSEPVIIKKTEDPVIIETNNLTQSDMNPVIEGTNKVDTKKYDESLNPRETKTKPAVLDKNDFKGFDSNISSLEPKKGLLKVKAFAIENNTEDIFKTCDSKSVTQLFPDKTINKNPLQQVGTPEKVILDDIENEFSSDDDMGGCLVEFEDNSDQSDIEEITAPLIVKENENPVKKSDKFDVELNRNNDISDVDTNKSALESKEQKKQYIVPKDFSKLKDDTFKPAVTIEKVETVSYLKNEVTIKNKPGPKSSKRVDMKLNKEAIVVKPIKDIENVSATKSDKDIITEVPVVKPVLICVDISKLKEKTPEKTKAVTGLKTRSSISPQVIDLEGEESNDIIDIPDSDPLAGAEIILPIKKIVESPKPAAKDFTLATFKLDGSDTSNSTSLLPEPIARALRNRKISIEAVDNRKRSRVSDEISDTGGKKPRLRGKRPVDVKLRRSVEQKLAEAGSSSDDSADQDISKTRLSKINVTPTRGTGKARRGRGRGTGRVEPVQRLTNNSPTVISDSLSDTSKTDDVIPTPQVIKTPSPRKKRARLLGLDIDPEILNATNNKNDGSIEECGRGSVRQSRRIAQIKIKEEAERRKIEEITLIEIKEDHKKKKHGKDDDKKKKKFKMDSDDEYSSDDEVAEIEGGKPHKKKKHKDTGKLFNTSNPWQSSSGSSTPNEEEEEEEVEEEPSDEEAVMRSDHEFSPESDLETDEPQPLRRARTVRKESDTEDPTDEHACQKCGKADHPEWILLCDKCDCGWHCSCLRPALLVIPEGDWFCPPCQHTALIDALRNQLVEFDKLAKRKETEVRRKERLAYVGISLDNVLPSKEGGGEEVVQSLAPESGSDSSDSRSSSGSSSGDESEPIYQLRERRTAHSYRFNDYDELINSAIQDDIDHVKGAGNQGRGKDIATIVNAEKEEAQAFLEQQQLQQQQPLQEPAIELPPPVVPVYEEHPVAQPEEQMEEDSEEELRVVPKHVGKKKHRKLNSLDISSEDDPVDDDDFKVTSASEEDELDELGSDDSDDMDLGRRGKRGGPIRRSTRARTTRYDRDFINDNSDEEPRKKKTRSIWDESESEESDKSWGKKKRVKKQRSSIPTPRSSNKKSRKKKKRQDDSDPEAYKNRKPKKPKIIFGGLNDSEDEVQTRRTRGKKINYIDALGSDTDEDKPVTKKLESEDEYVANEEDDDEAAVPIENKDSDSESATENIAPPPLHVPKTVLMFKSPTRGRGRGKAGLHRPLNLLTPDAPLDIELKPLEVMPKNTPDIIVQKAVEMDIPVIAANPDDLNEEEVGMMMENEEYAKKQLELMAIQLAKEKRRKELEAMQVEKVVPPLVIPIQPKKRGRKKKVDIEAAAAAALLAQEQNTILVPVNTSLISQSPSTPMIISPNLKHDDYSSTEVSPTVPTTIGDLTPSPPKRRGRGKGKKTLAAEAAAAAAAAVASGAPIPISLPTTTPPLPSVIPVTTTVPAPVTVTATIASNLPGVAPSLDLPTVITTLANDVPFPSEPPLQVGKLGIAAPPQPFSQSQPAPSVITRMLQSQPVSAQTFTTAANSMNQKYFGGMPLDQSRGLPPGQFSPMGNRGRVPSPYRQSPPGMNLYPGVRPVAPNSPHRLRSPGPPNMSQMFHSTHHSLDPSPSGGGPINITNRDRSSPAIAPPASSPMGKDGPTPPPPPYSRGPLARFVPGESSPGPSLPPTIRHHLSYPQSGTHLQQPSPPPRLPVPGNFSPYHPPPPPNYHYGAYPPAPSLAAADDALPPTDYQGSSYPEHFNTGEVAVHSSEGSNSKPFEEEGSGEFGGLVSYFSSQREDDLDT